MKCHISVELNFKKMPRLFPFLKQQISNLKWRSLFEYSLLVALTSSNSNVFVNVSKEL
jgi:hypothetical protein